MGDPVAFVRKCIDEDERIANASTDAFLYGDRIGIERDKLHPSVLMHVYTWVPRRVLAEVEMKRRLLDLHKACPASCYVVQTLALPYSDKPGYPAVVPGREDGQ